MRAPITELSATGDLRELERLFAVVWERAGEPPISADVMKALAHSGNYVVGAHLEETLIGGLVGWLGGRPPGELHLHSHILGVLAGRQAHGLGFELKQHQRDWCLERGVMSMEWTFDPLVRRNAYFNLVKLGADVTGYLVNLYGEMNDGLNAGEESDRLLITWRLDSPRASAAAAGHAADVVLADVLDGGAGVVLSPGSAGEPVSRPASTAVVLIQVPEDIVAMRRADAPLARSWRMAARRAMADAMGAGHRVIGVTRDGWYVLERQP